MIHLIVMLRSQIAISIKSCSSPSCSQVAYMSSLLVVYLLHLSQLPIVNSSLSLFVTSFSVAVSMFFRRRVSAARAYFILQSSGLSHFWKKTKKLYNLQVWLEENQEIAVDSIILCTVMQKPGLIGSSAIARPNLYNWSLSCT